MAWYDKKNWKDRRMQIIFSISFILHIRISSFFFQKSRSFWSTLKYLAKQASSKCALWVCRLHHAIFFYFKAWLLQPFHHHKNQQCSWWKLCYFFMVATINYKQLASSHREKSKSETISISRRWCKITCWIVLRGRCLL